MRVRVLILKKKENKKHCNTFSHKYHVYVQYEITITVGRDRVAKEKDV